MIGLRLPQKASRLMCLGAHSDDIEIGALATLFSILSEGSITDVRWVVFSAEGRRGDEARASAEAVVKQSALTIETFKFRERYLAFDAGLKEATDRLGEYRPDVVLAPWAGDLHQDHRVVAELAQQTFRDALILSYEIPKYDGDLGRPTVYVPVSAAHAEAKLVHLEEAFSSQLDRPWFRREVFQALMTLRGVECRAPSGMAEAFHTSKLVVST